MFERAEYSGDRPADYELLVSQLERLIEGEPNRVANLANAAALLAQFLRGVNWVGFYLVDESRPDELVLGPFQGLPACLRIPFGRGVCGAAALRRATVRVDDVHAFPGHIACDAASASEIVVPLYASGRLLGVLDVDSPLPARFDELDQAGLERFAAVLSMQL